MNKVTVYLDMDGVVSDFDSAFYTKQEGHAWDPDRFHNFIENGGFTRLQTIGHTAQFINDVLFLHTQNSFNLFFLSSCGNYRDPDKVYNQKRRWLDENGFATIGLICVKHRGFKKDFATPTSFLIDDTRANIRDWVDNGGQGLLIEQGFNEHWSGTRHLINTVREMGELKVHGAE